MSDLLTFPCDFPIKVIGLASDELNGLVLEIVRRHVPDFSEKALQSRPSKQGKYLAVTVTIQAESQEQLDKIYIDLSGSPGIVMAL